jgi:hypothetical protein
MNGPLTSPNVYLADSTNSLQIRSDTPSTVIPHPQQKAMSPPSPYINNHHSDAVGHHNDVTHHHYYSDNNNENDYSMHNYYHIGQQMSLPAMQQSTQGFYPSCPNSPESMAETTLAQLNTLPPYSCDNQDQVRITS